MNPPSDASTPRIDAPTFPPLTEAKAATLAAAPGGTDFKRDHRSHVRLLPEGPDGRWVVKTFLHPMWRQRLTRMVGAHPAAREAHWHANLQGAGVPVVPVAAHGTDAAGRGFVITPWAGESLHHVLARGDTLTPAQRHRLTRAAGALAGRLLSQKLYFRDHKASNLVVDADPNSAVPVRLIDAGACRSAKGRPLLLSALPMLTLLHRTAIAATRDRPEHRPTRADRLRFLRAVYAAWPTPPDGLQHLPRHPAFMETD